MKYSIPGSRDPGIEQPVNPESRDWRILSGIANPIYNGYSDNGYSDILDIVIILSLSIFPHLHIRHTKFIGYSDIMAIVIIWS